MASLSLSELAGPRGLLWTELANLEAWAIRVEALCGVKP